MEDMSILEAALSGLESSDYLSEYDARREAGEAGPLDRANAALAACEQAVVVLAGDQESTPLEVRINAVQHLRVCRGFAARAGSLMRAGDAEAAMVEAARAEVTASALRAQDEARFADLPNVGKVFADGRSGRVARRSSK